MIRPIDNTDSLSKPLHLGVTVRLEEATLTWPDGIGVAKFVPERATRINESDVVTFSLTVVLSDLDLAPRSPC